MTLAVAEGTCASTTALMLSRPGTPLTPAIVAQGDDEMRTGKLLVLFGLAAVMLGSQVVRTHTQTPAKAAAAAPAAASPNDELIKLAMAGMGEDILLATVAKTDKSKYDTSADALLKLKAAGISQKVIAAILGITPTPASAAAPASLPQPIAAPGAAGLAPKARPISGAEDPLPTTTAADETNLHLRSSFRLRSGTASSIPLKTSKTPSKTSNRACPKKKMSS